MVRKVAMRSRAAAHLSNFFLRACTRCFAFFFLYNKRKFFAVLLYVFFKSISWFQCRVFLIFLRGGAECDGCNREVNFHITDAVLWFFMDSSAVGHENEPLDGLLGAVKRIQAEWRTSLSRRRQQSADSERDIHQRDAAAAEECVVAAARRIVRDEEVRRLQEDEERALQSLESILTAEDCRELFQEDESEAVFAHMVAHAHIAGSSSGGSAISPGGGGGRHRAASRVSDSTASDWGSFVQSVLTTAGDYEDEDLLDRTETIREYAATLIQRLVRRRLHDKRERSHSDEVAAALALGHSIPESSVHAIRILQNRFRFQRLRRMVEDRERNNVVRRLQEAWRRRKELRRHFELLRAGREEAAARHIQQAFLRFRRDRNLAGRTEAHEHEAPAPETDIAERNTADVQFSARVRSIGNRAAATLPVCVICLTETVQVAFLPCGHAHVCVECGSQCSRCPACRRIVALQIRIYL